MLHNPYSHHYHHSEHLSVPYNQQIPHGLVPGKQIFISGHILPHADIFRIDLQGRTGIALHFNPRFHAHCVVRNSELNGGWGPEERNGPLPFTKGGRFEMIINVEPDKYRIAVNGRHCFDYHHRTPLETVNLLHISGQLQLNKVVFSGGSSTNAHEFHHPNIPFATPLPNGPRIGSLIQICGEVPHHCNRFDVNLQNGSSVYPNEIPLHISVRFDDPNTPQPVVVRTNRSYGNWGHEERHGHSPFVKGSHFEMLILIESHGYKIAVNGHHFTEFGQRNQIGEGNHLAINGNVHVHSIRIH